MGRDGLQQRHVGVERGVGTYRRLQLERLVGEAVAHAQVHQLRLLEQLEHLGVPLEEDGFLRTALGRLRSVVGRPLALLSDACCIVRFADGLLGLLAPDLPA